ncbi:HAMP domain-containing sensor histidine kinase [Nocardia sp. alder85J]|uniref:HAMP domain-containing sensor histidine kinase n=1 Tax=Nocardia sp. alder85J TaxID=2862949 RepID=UPI001CD2B3A1|nr:HAMP domain-containing sensor histidine kinase [Nocardia sp. alder85J]MCX4093290.1 ATP-binding protein [Nocardia sp. alder85J]
MRDAARPGTKRWALGNWDLRWKVTAVLAVPLLVAVVLGASRIASEFGDSSRLNSSVGQVEAIPAVTGLSAAAGTIAASQMVQIGTQSVVDDADLTKLDAAIDAAVRAESKLDGVSGGRAALDAMITSARAVRSAGKTPAHSVPDALNQEEGIRQNSVKTVESIVGTVADPSVESAKLRLVDSLNTRAALVTQSAAIATALRGSPKDGLRDYLVAVSTERQMLGVLAHRFPDGDQTIADLIAEADNRQQLGSGPQVASGQVPIQDMKQSSETSLADYQKIVDRSTADITSLVDTLADNSRTGAIRYSAIVITTILAALLLAVVIARSMIVPLRKLRLAALRVAEHDLGHEVSRLRDGASPEDVPLEPMPVHTDEEIGQLARAVDDIHGQALRLAADQAAMRTQVNDMFETLARRSKSLVDHQLSLIEAMEYDEKDPRLLENLFRLDHLAARMRRNGDNLLILAGTRQRRTKSAPVEIADVLRAAISEVEDYERVKLGATPRGAITEPAASDLAHLFAELLDNALRASPPETDVKFTFAQAHDQGVLIEVADRGIGMPPAEMADINRRLETTAEVGSDTARHMGLFVVSRLAERHGLTVRLRPTFDTARDPGVTVTVHVPKVLIVAPPGGMVTVPAPTPSQPNNPVQSTGPSSMQMRAVTRTPSGNMMVTVDPGVSGPISANGTDRTVAANGAAGINGTTGTKGPNGTPLSAPPSGPLPQREPGGGLPQRQPGTNGPTVRHTVSDPNLRNPGLPQRDPGANGPQQPQPQPGTGLPPRPAGSGTPQPQPGLAANMLKRQPGVTPGQPPRPAGPPPATTGMPPSGLPQRQPGSNGIPGGSAAPGPNGLSQRPAGPPSAPNGLPQRDAAPTGLPPRPPTTPGSGLPQRPAPGLPPREPGAGAPPRDTAAPGLPTRDTQSGGLPRREPTSPGMPQRDPATGLPQRDVGAPGLPRRDAGPSGLPQRDTGSHGLPQREPGSGLPQRDPSAARLPQVGAPGQPQRETGPTGLPQRDTGSHSLPQREAGATGLPQREAGPTGLPQRDTGSHGLPQREPGAPGLPQRDAGATRLPQRDTGSHGLPQRDTGAPGLPQRDAGATRLPQRDTGSHGLPQRDTGSHGLPQRDTGATGLPQRQPGGLPQRDATPDTGLPQRDPSGGLPTGLPRRQPGAGLPPRPEPTPGLRTPGDHLEDAAGDGRERGRHSYRANPQKTASFFQTRLQPTMEADPVIGGTPIFAEMMSAWLQDPNADRSQVAASFESPGDEGWQAARHAVEVQPERRTAAGLPQRDPGNRLVPGGVTGNTDASTDRDPESIRSSLSRHQQGVRDGRAMRAMNLTGDKGDR